jgi:uncharacterized protein (TIGR03000 family)
MLLGEPHSTVEARAAKPKTTPPPKQPNMPQNVVVPRFPLHQDLFRHRMLAFPYMPMYSAAQMPYGSGYSMMTPGAYAAYPMPAARTAQSATPASPAKADSSGKSSKADAVEVSGPLDAPPPHRAVIRLRLPRTFVDVSIDGKKIDTVGKTRTYVTPELPQARTFEVTAVWEQNGRTHRIDDKVTVEEGQVRTLDFTSPK